SSPRHGGLLLEESRTVPIFEFLPDMRYICSKLRRLKHMKILVLNPFAGEAKEVERCHSVARPETEIIFDNIADVFPLNYVTYIYYRHRCADAVVDRVVLAEEQGFD